MREAFDLADAEVRAALSGAVERIRDTFGNRVREISLAELCDDERAADPATWLTIYRVLQGIRNVELPGRLDRRAPTRALARPLPPAWSSSKNSTARASANRSSFANDTAAA